MSKQTISRLTEAMLETADGMRRIGVMDDVTHRQITIRHLGAQSVYTSEPITGAEIRTLRERANLSQAAFARYLNLTSGYISQLERGNKHPTGAALTLLNVIRRKGLEVIL